VTDILDRILERKHEEVEALCRPEGREKVAAAVRRAPAPRGFRAALQGGSGFRIIAEMKRASPSRGLLVPDYRPATLAREFEAAGAAAISVVTDPSFFRGLASHLGEARGASRLPVLRKDFLVHPVQVEESRALGADAVLLIAAALPGSRLRSLLERTRELEMDALVEVHDEEELQGALEAGADLVGVNNRDLKTFTVDLSVSRSLARRLPAGALAVSESGIRSRSDLEELTAAGYHAFLIGEALMTAPDPAEVLRRLVG
jgi:indole-3-glycerol phosphate synthase